MFWMKGDEQECPCCTIQLVRLLELERLTVPVILYGALSLPALVASECHIWHRFSNDD